jgi:hypothetical protein
MNPTYDPVHDPTEAERPRQFFLEEEDADTIQTPH